MTLEIIDTNIIGSTAHALGSNDAMILAGITVGSDMSTALSSSGNNQKVNVQGNVVGAFSALELGTVGGTGQHLTIGKNGYVGNSSALAPAVVMYGVNNQIDNAGTIDAEVDGIEMRGGASGSDKSTINNTGLIEARHYGIFRADIFSNYKQTIIFNNHGELRVTDQGGYAYYSAMHEAADRVINSGLIAGDIELGAGEDAYNGTEGRVVGAVYGGLGSDMLLGGSFKDVLSGDDASDTISGGGGEDYLGGGEGDDDLFGNDGHDFIDGGIGLDEIDGGAGDDDIFGDDGDDQIIGAAGDDDIYGGEGDDKIRGDDGNDEISGGIGLDTILGDAGDDDIYGHDGDDQFTGGEGNDIIGGGIGLDLLAGGNGDDSIDGDDGDDTIYGEAGNDAILGGIGKDTIFGHDGNDQIRGNAGDDKISGDAGNDLLDGGAGADTVNGGAGNDTYIVENLADLVVDTGGGIDTVLSAVTFNLASVADVQGTVEKLTLLGTGNINGTGNAVANTLTGNIGSNTLKAGAGNDAASGGNGNDQLFGEVGNDLLAGGAGIDKLYGGLGKDTMTGGADADRFVFDTTPNSLTNRDVITDFQHGVDRMFLDNAVFTAVGPNGALQGGFFHLGAAAHDADDRIVYNKASGVLSYDADGTGAQAAVQFAVLANKPVVTAGDFLVI